MGIIKSDIIYKGNLIDNYLVNFPEFINKEKNSIYKLVIGLKVTVFVVQIPFKDYKIKLPYYEFHDEHALFIAWGDGTNKKNDNPALFLYHVYLKPGTYAIYILGDTPNLYSMLSEVYANASTEDKEYLDNFKASLIDIRKLCDNLTDLSGIFQNYPMLSGIPDDPLPPQAKNCNYLFAGCKRILYIPFNFYLPEEGESFYGMFGWTGLKQILNDNFHLPYGTKDVDYMFTSTNIEEVPSNMFNNVTSTLTYIDSMFRDCPKLMHFNYNKKFLHIKKINGMFWGCTSLVDIKFNVPNVEQIGAVCSECSSLQRVEGITINLKTTSAWRAFSGCISLNQDISGLLTYYNTLPSTTNIIDMFYNCSLLRGTPKELYLWKSYLVGHFSPCAFFNCTHLNNYNWITSGWGGADDVNYWYGSYQIQITNPDEDIYCLPIYKFLTGSNTSPGNQEYGLLNSTLNTLTPYDFYINYGDDSTWHQVTIGDSVFFESFWENNKNSMFYGYPMTYKINWANNGNKLLTYNNLTEHSFFGYLYRDIMHRYEEPGFYKIMIMGRMPRFFVHLRDYLTNRHLYNIYTINKLPFVTLDHAFTNAHNLRYLPNEQLIEFPILSAPGNWDNIQLTYTYGGVECPLFLYGNQQVISTAVNNYIYASDGTLYGTTSAGLAPVTKVVVRELTYLDKIHRITSTDTNYCFANVNGYEDKLIRIPNSLFNINKNSTTFKYRTTIT